jgi:protein phosphatase
MHLEVFCQTDIGLRREQNQDSYLIDEALGLYVVADGMGGHRGGEVASAMAVQAVREAVARVQNDKRKPHPRQLLAQAYREASHKIYDRSHNESPELQGMGTTLVTALYRDGVMYVANVGDSRAYLFTEGKLWQITEDHSLVNEQIRAGLLTEREAENFAAKNVITRSVGFERDVLCDIVEREMQAGELLLICSDGLSGLVQDSMIAQLCSSGIPEQIVSKCIDLAKKNGGDDNITVMVIGAVRQ